MEKYSKYKDSGIEWLGVIPAHWEINRLKNVFSFGTGLSITKKNLLNTGIPCINYGEIHSKYGFEVIPEIHWLKCVEEDYLLSSRKSLLNSGDFVFADTSEDIEGSGNFTYLNSQIKVFAGYHTIIAKPKLNFNSRYVAYLLDSLGYRTQIQKKVAGIKVFSITQGLLKGLNIYFPPLSEQQAIATYLDKKTQAIDKKVSLLEQKISYYKELRKALINTTVTKGLNPNAPLKDSGIDWIGQIPEHWEVKRVKDIFGTIAGGTPSTKNIDYWTGEIPWIPSGKVQNNIINRDCVSEFISGRALKESSTKIAKRNSILIALTGATCSNIGLLTFDTTINQSIVAMLQLVRLNSKYFYYYLISRRDKIRTLMTGGAQGGINQEDVRFIKILYPSLKEQTTIANYLDEKTSKIDAIISNIEQQIGKAKELRKTLINDVVTGKIKVV